MAEKPNSEVLLFYLSNFILLIFNKNEIDNDEITLCDCSKFLHLPSVQPDLIDLNDWLLTWAELKV